MAYATVRDIPASWDRYTAVSDTLADPVPPGLLLHVAGPTDEGFRVIEIWESREDFERFQTTRPVEVETLAPATLRELDGVSTIHGSLL
ncbi:MAG: hypothetical protein ACRC50_14405 [Gaiella sp.]